MWDAENGRGDMRETPASTIKKYTKYQNNRFCGLWKYVDHFGVGENVGCGVWNGMKSGDEGRTLHPTIKKLAKY
jgi:hypothetical protein